MSLRVQGRLQLTDMSSFDIRLVISADTSHLLGASADLFGRLERLDRPTPAESAPSGALGHKDWACRGSWMAARVLRLQPCCGARKTLK